MEVLTKMIRQMPVVIFCDKDRIKEEIRNAIKDIIASSHISDMARQAKDDLRDRYIAAAKEKDPFWRSVKKPIVSYEEMR